MDRALASYPKVASSILAGPTSMTEVTKGIDNGLPLKDTGTGYEAALCFIMERGSKRGDLSGSPLILRWYSSRL